MAFLFLPQRSKFRATAQVTFCFVLARDSAINKRSHREVAFALLETGQMTTKDEIIKAIRESAEELGRTPTVGDLKRLKKIGLKTVKRYFGRYADALREAGFEPQGAGYRLELETLAKDWMEIARKLGKVPSLLQYNRLSPYSVGAADWAVWRVDGGAARDAPACPGEGTGRGVGRCNGAAGKARELQREWGLEIERREMEGCADLWRAADAVGAAACADQ
jgi:hypothetical protein